MRIRVFVKDYSKRKDITVERCLSEVPNKFELCLYTSQRVLGIQSGDSITIRNGGNDKAVVVALEEIARDNLNKDVLKDNFVRRMLGEHGAEDDESNSRVVNKGVDEYGKLEVDLKNLIQDKRDLMEMTMVGVNVKDKENELEAYDSIRFSDDEGEEDSSESSSTRGERIVGGSSEDVIE